MFSAQSTTNEYIRPGNKFQSVYWLFIPQVIIPEVSFSQTITQIVSTISEHRPRKAKTPVLEPIQIPRALNTGTCISRRWRWAGWPILLCGPTQEPVFATANTGEEKLGKNTGEWTGRVEICKEEILSVSVGTYLSCWTSERTRSATGKLGHLTVFCTSSPCHRYYRNSVSKFDRK